MRYLEVTKIDHKVVNCIVWDGVSPYETFTDLYLLKEEEAPGVTIGWQKIDDQWVAPIVIVEPTQSVAAPEVVEPTQSVDTPEVVEPIESVDAPEVINADE